MSKMGQEILKVQETVDMYHSSLRKEEILNIIRRQQGDMFAAIGEQYYDDFGNVEVEESHDIEQYEELCRELGIVSSTDG